MSLKNALLRPIEIKAGNHQFVIGSTHYQTGFTVFSTITVSVIYGIHSNIFGLIASINEALATVGTGTLVPVVTLYFTDDFKPVCSVVAPLGTVSAASVGDTALGRIIGFSGNESSGTTSVTGDNRPMHCWVPTFYTKDTDRLIQDSSSLFYGSIGSDGRGSGIPMTTQYERTLEWTNEKAPNVMQEASNESYEYNGIIYYPESERCFLNVLNSSRGSYSTASTSANVYSSGVYFIDLLHKFLGESPDIELDPDEWDSGGILFDITDPDNRDNFVFTYVKNPVARPVASDPRTASFYECTATLLTSTASDWETGANATVSTTTDPPS